MDTQRQNFWTESIDKEVSLRFAWQLKYSKQYAKKLVQQPPRQQKKTKTGLVLSNAVSDRIKKIEAEKTKLSADTIDVVSNPDRSLRSAGCTCIASPAKPVVLSNRCPGAKFDSQVKVKVMRDMRPPSQNTRAMLYSGISAHGEGRYAYLNKRKLLIPEQKYEFPVLSSCLYGWKITELTDPKPSRYARTCVIKDSFYRTSGIMFA